MQSSLLLLLIPCPWLVDCSTRPPSHVIETHQPYHSLERDQPYHSLERDQPYKSLEMDHISHSLKDSHSIKRSQPEKMRSPKSAEDIGCVPIDGTAYTGLANTTMSDLTCQMWSVNTPHEHDFTGVGKHNYCRGLDGYAPWCYTTNPGKEWEYCDVPFCMTYTKGI